MARRESRNARKERQRKNRALRAKQQEAASQADAVYGESGKSTPVGKKTPPPYQPNYVGVRDPDAALDFGNRGIRQTPPSLIGARSTEELIDFGTRSGKEGLAAAAGVAAAAAPQAAAGAREASRSVASEVAKFMKGRGGAIKSVVDEAIAAGGFPTSKKGIEGVLSKLGITLASTQPIVDAKTGLRAPGHKWYRETLFKDLNELIKGGAKPQDIRWQLGTAIGQVGPLYDGKKGYVEALKKSIETGKKGFMDSAKQVGKGLLLAFGAEMLLDPLVQKMIKQPAEEKRAKRAADLSASEMVEDYELARLIDAQAMSALKAFPSVSESLLTRMGGSGAGPTSQNTPQAQGPALPGEMYFPAEGGQAAQEAGSPFDELTAI